MVMKADVLARAIDFAAGQGAPGPVLCLSPRGQRFDQTMAARLAEGPALTLVCGRYEGIDQRVIDARGLIEVSVGDFVLTGGEIAAMAVLDATIRLRPGVLGNAASAEEESFARGLLEHPHYTRPQAWEGRSIPEVLLSGHHARAQSGGNQTRGRYAGRVDRHVGRNRGIGRGVRHVHLSDRWNHPGISARWRSRGSDEPVCGDAARGTARAGAAANLG